MKKSCILIIMINSLSILYSNDVLQMGAVIPEITVLETMDVLIEGAKRLNYGIEVVTLPAERSLIKSNRGELDGEVARIIDMDKKYENLIRIPETVTELFYYVYSNKDHNLNSVEEFFKSDLVLVNVIGIKFTENYKQNIPENRFMPVSQMLSALKMVAIGRGDIVIANDLEVKEIFKENTIPGLVKSKQPITSIKLYPYLNKKHKNLVEPLAQAMKDYKKTLPKN